MRRSSLLVPLFILGLALINFRGIVESVKVNVVLTCIELFGPRSRDRDRRLGAQPRHRRPRHARSSSTRAEIRSRSSSAAPRSRSSRSSASRTRSTWSRRPRIRSATSRAPSSSASRSRASSTCSSRSSRRRSCRSTCCAKRIRICSRSCESARRGSRSSCSRSIAMIAVGNTSLINLMMASRLLYGMSKERAIPRVFGAVHERRRTPWFAIICTTVIALAARELERRAHAGRHDGAAAACACSRS